MKGLFVVCTVATLALFTACGGNNKADRQVADDSLKVVNTVPEWTEADSTIYGHADGFGQGGFTLVADDGSEWELALTSENDKGNEYGIIYGERNDTARYAITTRDNNEALGVMINLSQLNKFVKDYDIYNCHLILKDGENRDWVEIEELNDTVFRAKGKSGKSYVLR